MSTKPNYFVIGLFVIAASILIVAAVVVFGSGLFTKERVYFETYFDSPVSGLRVGAPTEYRGVSMGQVEKITFARNLYPLECGTEEYYKYGNYVVVLAYVDKENVPALVCEAGAMAFKESVRRGLRVKLASNLLTGQAYLNGDYVDPNRYPPLEVPWKPENLYLPSAPGGFATIKDSLDRILANLEKIDAERIGDLIEEILVSVDQAIDDANISEVSTGIQAVLADADQVVDDANVPAISGQVQALLAEARQTNHHLQRLLKRPQKTDAQMTNVAALIANLNRTLLRVDRLISSQSPRLDQAMENLRDVSADLKDLTGSLKQHPSQAIFSQPPPRSERSK